MIYDGSNVSYFVNDELISSAEAKTADLNYLKQFSCVTTAKRAQQIALDDISIKPYVEKKTEFIENFEDKNALEYWSAEGEGGEYSIYTEKNGNKVLKITDNVAGGENYTHNIMLSRPIEPANGSVEISFKFKGTHEVAEGVVPPETDAYLSYSWFRFGNGIKTLLGCCPVENSSKIGFAYAADDKGNAAGNTSAEAFGLNEWHEIKIVYIEDGTDSSVYTADYYIDGRIVANGVRAAADIPVSWIRISSTTKRVGTMYIDDIRVKEI